MASTEPSQHSDVLIVGAGIFGTSTAYHLSLNHPQPSRITVLDRSLCPSPLAASSDINKIVRADYSKPFYMNLAYEAMDAWTSWEFLKPFYHQCGWVMLDETGSDLAQRIRRNFTAAGRPDTSQDVSIPAVKENWGGVLRDLDTTSYSTAYTNSSAGWADASLATGAMMNEAIANGVDYQVGEVTELVLNGEKLVGVRTLDGRLFGADKILLAVAAWTGWLMAPLEAALGIADTDSIERQIQTAGVCTTAFQVSDEEARYYGQMPVLIYGAQGEAMPPNRENWFKFTNANTFTNYEAHPRTGKKISVPRASQGEDAVPRGLKKESIGLVRQRVPGVLKADAADHPEWRLCWDAVSPDQSQLICRHPDARLSNLYFATAGSFHSWKFLPVIGKYVKNVLEGKPNGEEMDREWRWKREWTGRGAHEKVQPKGDLQDYEV